MFDLLLLAFLPIFVGVSLRNVRTGLLFWLVVSPFTLTFVIPMPPLVPSITFDMVAIGALYGGMILRGEFYRLRTMPTRQLDRWMAVFCFVLAAGLPLFYRPKDASMMLLAIVPDFVFPFLFYRLTRHLLTRDGMFDETLSAKIQDCMILAAVAIAVIGIYEGMTGIEVLPAKDTAWSLAHGGGLRRATGFLRVNGPYVNPETYGLVLALMLFLVVLRRDLLREELSSVRGRRHSTILVLVLLLLLPAIALNNFRSIWVAILAGLFIRFMVLPEKRLPIVAATVPILIIAIIAWPWFSNTPIFTSRISNSESYLSRIGSYMYALQAARQSPLMGVGFEKMPKYIEHALEAGQILAYRGILPPPSVRNTFLNLLAENGITGLLPFVMILVSLFVLGRDHLRNYRDPNGRYYGAAFLVFFVVYSVPMQFDRLIYDGKLNNVVFALAGLMVARLDALGPGRASRTHI